MSIRRGRTQREPSGRDTRVLLLPEHIPLSLFPLFLQQRLRVLSPLALPDSHQYALSLRLHLAFEFFLEQPLPFDIPPHLFLELLLPPALLFLRLLLPPQLLQPRELPQPLTLSLPLPHPVPHRVSRRVRRGVLPLLVHVRPRAVAQRRTAPHLVATRARAAPLGLDDRRGGRRLPPGTEGLPLDAHARRRPAEARHAVLLVLVLFCAEHRRRSRAHAPRRREGLVLLCGRAHAEGRGGARLGPVEAWRRGCGRVLLVGGGGRAGLGFRFGLVLGLAARGDALVGAPGRDGGRCALEAVLVSHLADGDAVEDAAGVH